MSSRKPFSLATAATCFGIERAQEFRIGAGRERKLSVVGRIRTLTDTTIESQTTSRCRELVPVDVVAVAVAGVMIIVSLIVFRAATLVFL